LNGGPIFTFSPAISLPVNCETQDEVDALWEKLSQGGEIEQCGWLRDKYGVSWQIVPTVLGEMMLDKDLNKTEKVMEAMLKMKKLDMAGLRKAYDEQSPSIRSAS
jgi:predicted 3-demethylubiquinone-9 3-methyltransferase (glyoxalase superfamily)